MGGNILFKIGRRNNYCFYLIFFFVCLLVMKIFQKHLLYICKILKVHSLDAVSFGFTSSYVATFISKKEVRKK